MKRRILEGKWISIIIGMIFLLGCATTQDVRILDREIRRLESQLAQSQNRDQKDREGTREELSNLKGNLSTMKDELSSLRFDLSSETQKLKADLLLRLESLKTETRVLSTGVEEYKEFLKKPTREVDRLKGELELRLRTIEEKIKTQENQSKGREERVKVTEEQLRAFETRWKGMEERLKGMEDRLKGFEANLKGLEAKQAAKPPEGEKPTPFGEKTSDWKALSARIGDLYKDAYETFQKGDLEGARKKFEAFLNQYPNTELSDNAQFWIGEIYFSKKDYERAILEYEKAIVKYPEGDKIPSALLKQGLAFLELGDKTNAKTLLRRVVERYPKTEQAEIAKKRLETLK